MAAKKTVKEYQTEELASDSEDEKRIYKAQERALKKKKQNASKKLDRERNSSVGTSRFRATNDDRTLFRGIVLALSLYFNRQVFALCLPLHCCSVFYASACWRRKIIFLRTNVVRKTERMVSQKATQKWPIGKCRKGSSIKREEELITE